MQITWKNGRASKTQYYGYEWIVVQKEEVVIGDNKICGM